jgi:hypothetical protein
MTIEQQIVFVIMFNVASGMFFYILGYKEGKREGIVRGKIVARRQVSK